MMPNIPIGALRQSDSVETWRGGTFRCSLFAVCVQPRSLWKGARYLEELKAQKQSAQPHWDVSIFNRDARAHSHTCIPALCNKNLVSIAFNPL